MVDLRMIDRLFAANADNPVGPSTDPSLARPPGGCRDWTGQLSIRCPKAPQGWSHVCRFGLFVWITADLVYFSLPPFYSTPIIGSDKPLFSPTRSIPPLPLTLSLDVTPIPPAASSNPPPSTPEPEQGSTTPPSDSVDTPVPVSEEVPPRPECLPRSNGSDECEFFDDC